MENIYIASMIAVIALVTMLLRFIPFVIFRGQKGTTPFIMYLGKALPFAIMGMLVIYCLKSVSVVTYPFGLPELIAGVIVISLHAWKGNSLVSIAAGTICYMLMVQFVFI